MLKTDPKPQSDDHQLVKQALRESEKRFRYLAEAAFEGIVIHAKGVVITGNDQVFKMFGYEPHELIGINALPICIAEESIEMVTHKIRTKDIGPYEVIGVRKDGIKFPLEVRAREVDWEGRKARVAAMMDITERKQAEAALRKANEELERRVDERTEDLVVAIGKLKQSEEELRRLSSMILTTQENERRRIAQELHDSIGQTLGAIKFKLNYALDKMGSEGIEVAKTSCRQLLPIVQNSIMEVRRISEGLRPPELDGLGILATINRFCSDFREIYTEMRFEEKHHITEEEVPESIKIVLYRVLQESLHNVVQHSHADRVTIALSNFDDRIKLAIEDNGQGFDPEGKITPAARHEGFGLSTMKERVKLAGGFLSVDSKMGQGTTITAWWS